ncbi:MAG: 1-acyl-sn-glycerol-3-phosphate acyltransferase [Oscillospiraceae bacterium]|nr:1-acyl-sn-glycerol-3-phosphate acyltransferase [Oscillospiraceae bacterium]
MLKATMKHYRLHRFMFIIFRRTAGLYIKRMMKYKCEKRKGPEAPSIIIANHNTNLDPVLIAMSYSRHMYFLTSEHVLRKGIASRLLRFFLNPIPINKSKTDANAIKEMIRRVRAGGNVCFFAEGDRSFSGTTGPITNSAAKLVKKSGADLITFRLEGGYFTAPRWARKQRRGGMRGRHVNRYSSEEIKTMSAEQITRLIESDIYEDAYERQKASLIRYRGKNLAEGIETVLYLCPRCEKLGTLKSEGERFFCGCGLDAVYSETGLLVGDGLRFSTIREWDEWQTEKLSEIVDGAGDSPICSDEGQVLYVVRTAAESLQVGQGTMEISRDEFHCAGHSFPMEQITRFAVTGQMTLIFALRDGTSYEVYSQWPRSALKYREIYRILTTGKAT